MYSYDRREVTARIKEITKAYIRTYTDNGQTKAYIEWVDDKGKKGTTEGDPENSHMKALLDRAKREKIKIETQKWAGAENISNSAWERGIDALIDNVQSMKKQVDRFGGIVNALGQGHGTTLKQQMTETAAILRTLQRRLGD
jgi:hypothetical protein